jgi:hypothetical protein
MFLFRLILILLQIGNLSPSPAAIVLLFNHRRSIVFVTATKQKWKDTVADTTFKATTTLAVVVVAVVVVAVVEQHPALRVSVDGKLMSDESQATLELLPL